MFCPTCGTENQDTVKFCRRCGVNLSAVLDKVHRIGARVAEPLGDLSPREQAVRALMRKIEQTDPKTQSMWGETILPQLVKELRRLVVTPEEIREKYIRNGMVVTGVGIGLALVLYLFAEALISSTLLPAEVVPIIRVTWAKGLIPLFIGLMMILYGLVYGRIGGRRERKRHLIEAEPETPGDEVFVNRPAAFGSVTEQTTKHLEASDPETLKRPIGGRQTAGQ